MIRESMKRRANVYFLRKIASDELRETLFFCTGESAVKEKTPTSTVLRTAKIEVKVNHTRSIKVNQEACGSVWEAKYVIGQMAGLDPV
jgi:D-mannonate dehydratase